MSGIKHRPLAVLAATAALAAASVAPGPAAAVSYEPEPAFCRPTVLHDYLKALDRLPPLRWPKHERLGFAPMLRLISLPQLLSPSGFQSPQVGFRLFAKRRSPAYSGWTVTATLTRVRWNGRVLERVARANVDLGTSHGKTFVVGQEPGAYRLTIDFRSDTGKRLGSFGRYFRIVQPNPTYRFALNATAYRPEQTVFGRIENVGSNRLAYGGDYSIERREEDGTWVHAPEHVPLPETFELYGLPAGTTSWCAQFWIPPGMPAGRYRMVKYLSTQYDWVFAEFEVLP